MAMIQTVIGINSGMMRMPDKKMDYKKELQEIIDLDRVREKPLGGNERDHEFG